MRPQPRILYLATTATPRIPGTDAVFQDIDALRGEAGGELLNLYPLPFATRFFPPLLLGLHAIGRLRQLAAGADLLHIFAPGLWYIPALSRIDKPIIHTVTASLHDRERLFSIRAAGRASGIAVSHPADVDWLTARGVPSAAYIPPAIELPGRPVPDNRPGQFTILVGSAPWSREQFRTKGVDALLAAVETLPDVNLIFLWRGFELAALEQRITQRGLKDRVEVIDEHADVYALLSRSHAAIVLAEHAGVIKPYPHSLLEAIAAGRPVIVSGCIGMADDIRRSGCGTVTRALTRDSIAIAINDLRSDYSNRALAAEHYNCLRFSRRRSGEQYALLYQEIWRNTSAPRAEKGTLD